MARPIVVLNCARNYTPGWLEQEMPRLVAECEVRLTEAKDGPDLARELADADALVARRDYVGRATLELTPRLRGIVTPGVGVEKVDVAAATELGIVVANSPGNSVTVAESAILLMLALAKQLPMWIVAARTSTEPTSAMRGMELRGKTLGIVGLGRIGRLTAELGRAFGMRVLGCDPYVAPDELRRRETEPVSLDQLLAQSDVITVHTPLTTETQHIINAETIAKMKAGVVFVNTCRGKTQDERALFEGLTRGRIKAAGLDVWEEEPTPVDNPLLNLETVVCTSHIAGVSDEANRNIAVTVVGEMLRVLRGEKPQVLGNPPSGPALPT